MTRDSRPLLIVLFIVCLQESREDEKEEAPSPAEALNHHVDSFRAGPLEDDHGDYPVPQVRAPRVPLRPMTLGGKANRTKLPAIQTPTTTSTSAVLASIGTRTNYVGPPLLRSRQLGMKRSIPSSGDPKEGGGEETSKKPNSESSAVCHLPLVPFHSFSNSQRRIQDFRVPFKVPSNSVAASVTDLPVASTSNVGLGGSISDAPKTPPTKGAPMDSIQSPNDDVEVFSSYPLSLSAEEIDLEAPFSQKIPIATRNATYTSYRRALHKIFAPGAERDNMWHKLHMDDSSEGDSKAEIRSLVLSSATKVLEFAVFSMCVTKGGYVLRSRSAIKSVKRLAREDAWGTAVGRDHDDDVWGVIEVLRDASRRAKESLCQYWLSKPVLAFALASRLFGRKGSKKTANSAVSMGAIFQKECWISIGIAYPA
ncbi:hypothetical protein EDB84DRAFT_1679664 [Lactarius hengduanensis]|nr:hypothetical protein EDB84DRAFT_1679664 [Lactarius hengduanensis]